MTSYYPLVPQSRQVPTFQPVLDGQKCTCTVTWNLFGQRYYLNCFDQDSNLVFTVALVETPAAIELSGLSWSAASLRATATTSTPHGFPLASTQVLTIAGAQPAAYNGEFECFITTPDQFEYDLSTSPGNTVVFGSATQTNSMSVGYFDSTLIYRAGQFEVSP